MAENYRQSLDDARAAIEDHIGSDISSINKAQRILLIAEDFDPALLIAVEWLHENHDLDVRCYRLQLSQENENDYLTCTCIYPPIEIATLTRGSGSTSSQATPAWTDWDSALASVDNQALKDFVKAELAIGQESRPAHREVIYRIDGKRRFWVGCRRKYAYVWQWGRFNGDDDYWRGILSEPKHVAPVASGGGLRFHLTSASDFPAFRNAITNKIPEVEFSESGDFEKPPEV